MAMLAILKTFINYSLLSDGFVFPKLKCMFFLMFFNKNSKLKG